MNTLELIKDAALFGGTVPNERVQEVKDYLKKVEQLMNAQKQVKNIAYEPVLAAALTTEEIEQVFSKLTDDERYNLIHRCCHGCGSLDSNCRCWDDS